MADTLDGARPVPTDPDQWRRRLHSLEARGVRLPYQPPDLSTTRPTPSPFTGEPVVRPDTRMCRPDSSRRGGAAIRRRNAARRAAEDAA